MNKYHVRLQLHIAGWYLETDEEVEELHDFLSIVIGTPFDVAANLDQCVPPPMLDFRAEPVTGKRGWFCDPKPYPFRYTARYSASEEELLMVLLALLPKWTVVSSPAMKPALILNGLRQHGIEL